MMSSHLNLSVTCTTSSSVPNTSTSRAFNNVLECSQFYPRKVQLNCYLSARMVSVSSFKGLQLSRALHLGTHSEEASQVSECREQDFRYFEGEPSAKEIHLDDFGAEERTDIDYTESQRRKKIGLANKGKIPWNKGKKHSAETRERIRQRTKEALRDPKVKKKMSERPRTLSNQTKARIRTSIRRLWEKRLKWKREKEKFISSWAEGIAKAAKKGSHGQQELDWDSYDKISEEIALQYLQWAADKVIAKKMELIREDRLAKAKAEKMEKLALKTQMEKIKGLAKKKLPKKSKAEKEELAAADDLKLKERLTKIHRKKSVNGQLSQDQRSWERVDFEFMKRDRRRKEVSLADQIRDVKIKKAEVLVKAASPSNRPSSESLVE